MVRVQRKETRALQPKRRDGIGVGREKRESITEKNANGSLPIAAVIHSIDCPSGMVWSSSNVHSVFALGIENRGRLSNDFWIFRRVKRN